jgi:ATP-dependent RNA helicase HelY
VAGCPRLGTHLKGAAAVDKLAKDTDRLRRRVQSRSESLARQFDRVLRVLESWGYVDGWNLTDGGALLSRIYSEADLLVAEALRTGVLDDVTPAEFAALVSCFTYERRGSDAERSAPPSVWPTSKVAQRARDLRRISKQLRADEDDAGLPETRPPDPGLADAMYAWASGDALADVLDEDDELTGGDFVRNVKQVVDLTRQIATAAPSAETRATADAAADACFRGVVAASSVVP